jgi:molybdenum-dependent DNA-binding transcriptional regulator ModE
MRGPKVKALMDKSLNEILIKHLTEIERGGTTVGRFADLKKDLSELIRLNDWLTKK